MRFLVDTSFVSCPEIHRQSHEQGAFKNPPLPWTREFHGGGVTLESCKQKISRPLSTRSRVPSASDGLETCVTHGTFR
jgi:hypothetical protein